MPYSNSEQPIQIVLPLHIVQGALVLSLEHSEQLSQLCGRSDQFQLTLIDERGNRYPCVLHFADRHLYGIDVWQRQEKPRFTDKILLEASPAELAAGSCHIKIIRSNEVSNTIPKADSPDSPLSPPDSPDLLYLGQRLKLEYFDKTPLLEPLTIPIDDLIRHLFICGVTGAGKTVLGKILVEEAALHGVPAIVIDLKGDLSSLALRFPSLRAEEFEPWVEVSRHEDRAVKAAQEADQFRQKLGRYGLSSKDVSQHCSQVEVNVFTPRSNKGFRLALSPFVEELSSNLSQLMADDADGFVEMIDALSASFVSRLTFRKREKREKAKAYIFELVQHACKTGVDLLGEEGLRNLIKLIEKPPISHVAARTVDEFINLRERAELANEVNNLLAGAGKLWFDGLPFYLDDFVSKDESEKTPINIINVSGMNHEDQSFVITHITFSIYLWMKRHGGSQEPRLIFYIDEIGAGGGNLAFYPSYPYNPPSKLGIDRLVRQGRSFGVCCVLATQSPGDVDYKGVGQCQTWIVGKLQREREMKKIEEGASAATINFKGMIKNFIPNFDAGEFLEKKASGELDGLRERWLFSYHRCLSLEEVGRIKSMYENRAEVLFMEALSKQEAESYSEAKPLWRDFIRTFRYSERYPKALLNLGRCLFELKQYDEAIKTLERLIKRSYDRATLSEARFLLAKCRREKSEFEKAEQLFKEVVAQSEQPQQKQEAFIWGEYCGQAWRWQYLHELLNLRLWFPESSDMPESVSIPEAVSLQPREDNIVIEPLPPRLPESLLHVPQPLRIEEELKRPVEVAEEEINRKRAIIREQALSRLKEARASVKAGSVDEARKIYKDIIRDYQTADLEPERDIWVEVDSFNIHLAERMKIRRKKIQGMDGHEFEIQIGRLYRAMGYTVRVTARNGGIDVWAFKENRKVVIQCKHWKNPVGPKEIREFNGSQGKKIADEAIFVTSSIFTEQAKAEASMADIKLIDGSKLIELFTEYYVETAS